MSKAGAMRIDRLLCYLRFARTRSLAAKLVGRGHLRCNGIRITRSSHTVMPGDVLTIPVGDVVKLIEITALPKRRGPPQEAQGCYHDLRSGA
ncbi:RNA-binding S4 domain-containing protein [Qipengyuania sp. DGS5-3]|uniref:RNA-binding S4 domain-containing protein n=1 Tax=Qipengyuania sp. DGS5-3 TaxID=3349632 RepID=UPI0036D3564A